MHTEKKPTKTRQPYGLWSSHITPELIGATIRLSDPQWDQATDTLVWKEERSGKGVLMAQSQTQAPYVLSESYDVRGGIGYGGGDFTVGGGLVVFAERNGRLYRRSLGSGFPQPITPAFGKTASPQLSPDGHWVLFVHAYEERDVLALVDSQGDGWPLKLAEGADFYMQPVWHPSGELIAWVEWDHPNMPWDGSRLMMARLNADNPPTIETMASVAGSDRIPVLQPVFSPDGRYLSYIRNKDEWDQLVLHDVKDGGQKVLVDNASLLKPAWIQGVVVQAWKSDSQHIYFLRNRAGVTTLDEVSIQDGAIHELDTTPYTSLSQPSVNADGSIALVASAPTISPRVISLKQNHVTIHQRSASEALEAADLPSPYEISWKSSDDETVFGIYSPPTNSRYEAAGLPPAIIFVHGGPTSNVSIGYDLEIAFFTSRGYACLEVNYRGSTGYGRRYREALNGEWGNLDVLDAVGGAQALVDQGLADAGRLVIKGGSAGGYTVLNALIRYPGFFKAGICSYGVSNLFTLAMDTHKFEAHYTDKLVGMLPEAAQKYRDWSPTFQVDRIEDPLLIFQGEEDNVVPPSQSEEIVRALRANGIPHEYHLYPGEGHGFRQSETRRAYYAAIERFLLQYVVFG